MSDIVEDKDGSLLIGTNSGGLIRLSADGKIQNIKSKSGEDNQLDVKCIFISPYTGRTYVGADRAELFFLDKTTNRLKPMSSDSPKSSYAIEDNKKNGFFIGAFDGLYEYNEIIGRFTRIYL